MRFCSFIEMQAQRPASRDARAALIDVTASPANPKEKPQMPPARVKQRKRPRFPRLTYTRSPVKGDWACADCPATITTQERAEDHVHDTGHAVSRTLFTVVTITPEPITKPSKDEARAGAKQRKEAPRPERASTKRPRAVSSRPERACTVEGCTRPHKARGFCKAHYMAHMRAV